MPRTFDEIPLFLTPDQFAAITGRNADAVRRSIREGAIPADKVSNGWLISRDAVFKTAAACSRARRDGSEGVVACG